VATAYSDVRTPRGLRWPLVAALAIVHALVAVVIALDARAPRTPGRPEAVAVAVVPEPPKPPPRVETLPRPLPVKRIVPLAVAPPPPIVVPDLPREAALRAITLPPDPPVIALPAPAAVVPVAPVAVAPETLVAPRVDAAYLDNPAPAYPSISRRQREQGRVLLRVRVGADGRAESVEIAASSGYDRLDLAAQDAVRRWRFVPARRGAQAVAAFVNVPISFSLERS